MTRPTCLVTGKDRYPNRLEADMAIARITLSVKRKRSRRQAEPTRSYDCEFCTGWHLTSHELRSERAR